MAIPKNKEELLIAIDDSYTKLKTDLALISSEEAINSQLEGHAKGTSMSIKDLLAYLVGWGELVLKWERKKIAGEVVNFPETGYKWNELGQLAQKFYADYAPIPYEDLLLQLEITVAALKQLIQKYDNTALYEKPWYDKWTMGRLIQLNSSSPYKNARTRIRKWKRLKYNQ